MVAQPAKPRSPFSLRRAGLPLLVLVAGIIATILAAIQLNDLVRRAEALRFETLVDQRADAISDRIDTYVALLRGVAGFLSAADNVDEADFRAYYERLRLTELYPGVQGIGVSRVVPKDQREAFVAQQRAAGSPNFRLWPEGERDVYTSIVYLEPREIRNETAIGFDMFSEPVRRAAMERARDTGVRAASGRVVLVQETDKQVQQPGFLIYVPLYATVGGAVPATLEERRTAISGWIYSPFRAGDLFTRAFEARGRTPELDFAIYDGPASQDNLLYASAPESEMQTAQYRATRTFDIAGRPWTLLVRSTDFFTPDTNRASIPFIIAGGLLATLLLSGASFAQVRATGQAENAREELSELNASLEQRVGERTAQLESARGALETLNRNLETMVSIRTSDLQAANEEIQRFAYIVSHDLRSPLVNVMGFTSELEVARNTLSKFYSQTTEKLPDAAAPAVQSAIDEDLPEAIEFIRSSTAKMDRLINAILKLSREGRRVLVPEQIELGTLMDGIGRSLKHTAMDSGAKIEIADLPDVVSDRLALEQIFSNLLENAVKYLAPDRPGRIRVRGWQEGSTVVIDVEDNGRGIDPRDHSRVFDLFRRAGAQDRPGEGIGLAHVRALVRRLGGTITLNSTEGEGSTFRVRLPKVLTRISEGGA